MNTSFLRRSLMVFVFMGTFSVFLYVANLVVYEALAAIFVITPFSQLQLLALILGVFSGSFIIASMVGMRFYNTFTRLYYYISAVWIGLFTYLFLASVLYGLLVLMDISVAHSLGTLFIATAVGMSIYGVIHARDIKIVQLEVTLPNLPMVWKGRKAIWISDVHLGQLYSPSFAKKIVEMVNTLPHDIIFIGGDLYDGTGASDISELVAPLGEFTGKLGIYFITGNHEEIGDSGAFVSAVRSAKIRPLLDEMVEIDGLQLIGVDYRNSSDTKTFRNTLSGFSLKSDRPSILLKHEPKDIDVARDAGISFQISGHTHEGQLWPFGYIANLVYKGFGYGLKKSGDMQVYTSSGAGTWGPPMRIGTDSEIVCITFV